MPLASPHISIEIPLFPLHTVLFPGGHLPLRIFEQRYIDMVRECSARNICFGVCLIDPPKSTNHRAGHMRVGTTALICDWFTLDDGLLGITARGGQRFIVQETRMRENGLLIATVDLISEPLDTALAEQYSVLSMIASRFMEKLGKNYPDFRPENLQETEWIGYRLAELLPLESNEKQSLLQISDPLERLQLLLDALPRFQEPKTH